MLGWVYSFWVHAAVETCNVNDKCEVVCVSKSVYIFKYIYTTCLLMHMCDLEPQVHAISENCMHLRLEAVHQLHDEYTNISHIHIYMNIYSCVRGEDSYLRLRLLKHFAELGRLLQRGRLAGRRFFVVPSPREDEELGA